ncbi:hypothetical protein G6F31_014629 [Rhizopus arrhizus]|nr:hypothetical protein G6F31_014629 [Rhizopus arrhizus]
MAESTRSPHAVGESIHHLQADAGNRHHHQLSDAIARLDGEGLAATVPDADQQRPLVVGVDQAGTVAEHDAVAVAQPRTRQDHRAQVRIGDVDGQAAGDQRGIAGLQGQRGIQRRAQVHAGAGFGGIGRQRPAVAEARIEQLDLQRLGSESLGHAWSLRAISASSCSASSRLEVAGNTCSPSCQKAVAALLSLSKPPPLMPTWLAITRSRRLSTS